MANEFDINQVIKHYGLSEDEVAEALFPDVRYKNIALKRIQNGEAQVNTQQLQALANLAGVLISDLFTIDNWKGITEDGCLTLIKGEYKTKLNYNGVWLSLYKNNKLIAQEMFTPKMSIEDFVKHIDNLITVKNNGSI